ncbi:MAG TPA: hypothetical protein VIK14_16620 [Ignavibacteria bacterium]
MSAAIQFGILGILGTLGEFISQKIKTKSFSGFGSLLQIILEILGWALLGIIIKYGFTGLKGFVNGLIGHNLSPDFFKDGIGFAFAVSVFTNVLFGPQMIVFHRFTNNLTQKRKGYKGIQKTCFTLIWFWIPAHTDTFSLPKDFQIGLAAYGQLCSE